MHAYSVASDSDRLTALRQALAAQPFLVVGLCAAWCGTCGQFRTDFDRLAGQTPGTTFVWLDIEDDAELVGEIDVDNFPTIAVFHDDRLLHFGVSLPQAGVVARLLSALSEDGAAAVADPAVADPAVRGLRARLLDRAARG